MNFEAFSVALNSWLLQQNGYRADLQKSWWIDGKSNVEPSAPHPSIRLKLLPNIVRDPPKSSSELPVWVCNTYGIITCNQAKTKN